MIRSLTIENFQSHEKTSLSFHPGVNVIVGPSDSGKTAILRALYWLCRNRPLGESETRSSWGGDTRVEAVFREGKSRVFVTRERTASKNLYRIETASGSLIFKAIRSDVPQEVREAIRMPDLNWQMQLDSPFLLSHSSGDVAFILNQIVHLDKIDSSLSTLNVRVRSNAEDLRLNEQRLQQGQESLKKFDYLPDLQRRIEALTEKERVYRNRMRSASSLRGILGGLRTAKRSIAREAELLAAVEPGFNRLQDLVSRAESLRKKVDSLQTIRLSLRYARRQTKIAEQILVVEDRVEILAKKRSDLAIRRSDVRRLREILTFLEGAEVHMEYQTQQIRSLSEKFRGICPTCGQELRA